MSDYIQTVLEDHGTMCGNCRNWRLLEPEKDLESRRIIEECHGCGDESYDIYEVADDCA